MSLVFSFCPVRVPQRESDDLGIGTGHVSVYFSKFSQK